MREGRRWIALLEKLAEGGGRRLGRREVWRSRRGRRRKME
jgi:hypothetical protein